MIQQYNSLLTVFPMAGNDFLRKKESFSAPAVVFSAKEGYLGAVQYFRKKELTMPREHLMVCETFKSIQGESTHAGRPCFFIRLAGCNLHCSYCDTLWAQDGAQGISLSVDDLCLQAEQAALKVVEITGGEPMLQKEAVCLLAEKLIARGHIVMMETNGSVDLSMLPEQVIRVIDWKTPSSGEQGKMYEENFRSLRPHDEVKFVCSDERDYLFALEKIRTFKMDSQTENLLVSPVYGALNCADLVSWILRDQAPVRVNLQIHKYIWDPQKRGV